MKIKNILLAIAAVASLSVSALGNTTEMITNGNFETGDYGQIGWNGHQLAGWSTTGYNFLFSASNDDSTGTTGSYGAVKLWGPGSGSANGLAASPLGGNYVASDGAFGVAPLSQTVNGLVTGQKYNLSFYWGGAQQYGFDGTTTEQWKVSFGNDVYSTAVANNSTHGFTGWMKENVSFTATSTSQVLSFLAVGTPNGVPPFSLLDGVSLSADVPEPGSMALFGLSAGILALVSRRRKSASK